MRFRFRLPTPLIALVLALTGASAVWPECVPVIPVGEFVYRFGLADSLRSDGDILELLENPTSISLNTQPTPEGTRASTVATTETHALYPVSAQEMVSVLQDDSILPTIMPDLTELETLCNNDVDLMKQMQRVEFNVLFLTFGTEYLIEVRTALDDSDEYGSYWGMYESLDGKLAYQYGSWYFANVLIDGNTYAYVRHYLTNGVVSRIPGLRLIMERSGRNRVATMLNAIYDEALRRRSGSGLASAR